MGKYTGAEKLQVQVTDASNRILGVEHPNTISAMAHLAATYRYLGKYKEAEKLDTQACQLKSGVLGEESHTITNANVVHKAQGIQVLDAGRTVPGDQILNSTRVILSHPAQAVLPDTTMNSKKTGIYLSDRCLNPSYVFILSLLSFQCCKESFKI